MGCGDGPLPAGPREGKGYIDVGPRLADRQQAGEQQIEGRDL